MIQKPTPIINVISMKREISSADLVLMIFISCGRNAAVVNIAAKYPNIEVVFI